MIKILFLPLVEFYFPLSHNTYYSKTQIELQFHSLLSEKQIKLII
jgi:hypothetical protein